LTLPIGEVKIIKLPGEGKYSTRGKGIFYMEKRRLIRNNLSYQVTIPISIVKEIGLEKGDYIEFIKTPEGEVVLRKEGTKTPLSEYSNAIEKIDKKCSDVIHKLGMVARGMERQMTNNLWQRLFWKGVNEGIIKPILTPDTKQAVEKGITEARRIKKLRALTSKGG
jgi:AbrB family looped-hinge helix DNA binding protein